jgi:ATP-binding cassette subfamily F protein 3
MDSFEGAVLLISHDRALLDAVGTRTIAVEDRALHSYEGGWAEYLRVREEAKAVRRAKPAAQPAPVQAAKSAGAAKPGARNGSAAGKRRNGGAAAASTATAPGPSREQRKRARQLETDIAKAEAALARLEDELADPSSWGDGRSAQDATARHRAAKDAIEALYAELELVAG